MEKVDMDVVYARTLKEIKSKRPTHPILKLSHKNQIEFMQLLLRGQGYYIKEGIKAGAKQIALPGLGTFLYNPLRKIANEIRNRYKHELYPFEINQLIKESLAEYFVDNSSPFKVSRGRVYPFKYESKKSNGL